jgi:ATP-binding cassette subfamily F protein 3
VRSGLRLITLKDVDHAYGDLLFIGMQYLAERGQRTVLSVRMAQEINSSQVAGRRFAREWRARTGHNVRTGYFSQNRIDVLNASNTVLESARICATVSEQTARTVLGSFVSRRRCFQDRLSFSGGEKSRLALVRLLLDPPNLLLMDEPTTHLDVGSMISHRRAQAISRDAYLY